MNKFYDIGIAGQIGRYSDAAETSLGARIFVTSGTPGLTPEGRVPEGIAAQAEQAWHNVLCMLKEAGLQRADIFRICQYLTRQEDIKAYVEVRSRRLGDHRPASMLLVVPALVRPEFLVEIEVYAAKRD
jgi:enamine deaminase RidA (YjgF/YER057c/UK114 family)